MDARNLGCDFKYVRPSARTGFRGRGGECQISINGKKRFKRILKRILSCLFGGRRKGQVTKLAFEGFIFVLLCSAANSAGTSLEFAAFGSDPNAKYSRASAFWFFLSTTLVFVAVRTHFLRKSPVCLRRSASCHRKRKR